MYRYQRGRFYRGWGFGIGFFVVVTLIIVLSISLSIRYNDNNEDNNYFAAGDTRIISYSPSFCDGLTLSGDNSATLYLLRNTPPLSGPTNTLTVQAPSPIKPDTYQYLYYYLHYGSEFTLTYCIEDGSITSLSFAFIKGKNNFNNWVDDGDTFHTIHHFTISNMCSDNTKTFTYTKVTSEDTYYFAFDNIGVSSVFLRAELELNRTEYLPNEVGIYDSCSIDGGDSCSVPVPFQSNYTAVLEIGSNDIAPNENVAFDWSCNARAWIYVLIVLMPLLFVVTACVIALLVCIYFARKRSQNYTTVPATETTPETAAVVDTTKVTTTTTTTPSAPPPVNPDYSPAPPSYGATHAANPPPYSRES